MDEYQEFKDFMSLISDRYVKKAYFMRENMTEEEQYIVTEEYNRRFGEIQEVLIYISLTDGGTKVHIGDLDSKKAIDYLKEAIRTVKAFD